MSLENKSSNLEEKDQDQESQLLAEYVSGMESYQHTTKEVRALERRYPPNIRDQATLFKIQKMDEDRHQVHLELIEKAKKLGKDKNDVLIDIIRWENSLEEYELPEFSILKSSDIVDTQGFHSAIQFNINTDAGKPDFPTPLDKTFGNYEIGEKTYDGVTERVLQEDKILIVFSINPIEGYGDEEIKPFDFEQREERAQSLAEEIGGEYFDSNQGGYHGTSARIIGVVISKNDLEKVARIIRNNPKKFRLGKDFYEDEKAVTSYLLEKVNQLLYKIGSDFKISELPKLRLAEIRPLKDKKIVMVDDDEEVFRVFIPLLTVATNGKADVVGHFGQSLNELIEQILELNPEVILLDRNLSMGIDGVAVAQKLIEKGFDGNKIIGFSSSRDADQAFKKAGIRGSITKNPSFSYLAIDQLASLVNN